MTDEHTADGGSPAAFPETASGSEQPAPGLAEKALPGTLMDMPVSVEVIIGSARVPLSEITKLGSGSTIALDQPLGSPASILVNGKEVAKGELFVLEGENNRLGITVTEVSTGASSPAR